MAQVLDFNKVKKSYLTIILPDEEQTKLSLMTPTKKLLNELSEMLPEETGEMPSEEDLESLFELTARLMSRNKTGKQITAEQLSDCLDFEDLVAFFNAYTEFVSNIANSKN